MSDEVAERRSDAVSGVLYEPGQAPALAGLDPAQAGMGIGGPLAGKVLRSNSSRLYYRLPSATVVADFDTGRIADVTAEAPVSMTYVPRFVTIIGRTYRIWVDEEWWSEADGNLVDSGLEDRVIATLIDADPADCRRCQLLPVT